MEKRVDLSSWNRKEIFDFFSHASNPYYMVSFRLDVTNLYSYVKQNHLSFYYSLIYLCTQAINEVDAFRYVIRGDEVYYLSERMPSFTDLKKDSNLFHIVTMHEIGSLEEFNVLAKKYSNDQQTFIDIDSETDRVIYYSCLPWMDITAVTNERDFSSVDSKNDSIPRIAWGKYVCNGERLELGVSIEVNHRLIDGVHLGEFAQKLEQMISKLGK